MPAKTCRFTSPPRLTVSLSSFFASGTSSAAMHAGDAQIDLGEVVDRDQLGRERLGVQGGVGVVRRALAAPSAAAARGGGRVLALLSSIMASTSFRSTRFIMCVNVRDRRADERLLRLGPSA